MCSRHGGHRAEAEHYYAHADGNASTYLFNKHQIKHRFCPACGIHPYGEATAPSGELMAAMNLRCIEGIDLDAIPVTHFDGRSL